MPDTTAKIQAILDDALRESFPEATDDRRTRAIRRRQKLYGVGGGASLPRLSRKGGRGDHRPATTSASGFPGRCTFGEEGTVLSHGSRPSDHLGTYEHDAWYRMSYWENITSHHTQPDRTFLGTSEKRHRAAIGAARREPWYGGSCPSGIASSVPFADAVRYGYAGARKERAYRQFPNAAPARAGQG